MGLLSFPLVGRMLLAASREMAGDGGYGGGSRRVSVGEWMECGWEG